ncbi:hypothetical protein GGR56DRAFT_653913 [Xylariaceae sp. FL0804]|nr:hypothetical protein GGR56DRAFT_653913 [Xylariaceae sp. FL0804]
MASPLSPLNNAMLNSAANLPARHNVCDTEMEIDNTPSQASQASQANSAQPDENNLDSSPFVTQTLEETDENKSPASPTKSRHSRVLSGPGLSPLKILSNLDGQMGSETQTPQKENTTHRSPRKISPVKRFPVKVSSSSQPPTEPAEPREPEEPVVHQREMTLKDAMKENKDLAQAIQILEDEEDTVLYDRDEEDNATPLSPGEHRATGEEQDAGNEQVVGEEPAEDEAAAPDDTMMSTFSTFSAVPNMTMFARIGHSPTRFAEMGKPSSRGPPESSPYRTPRPATIRESGNSTNLLDFTEQIQGFQSRYGRHSPTKGLMGTISATPNKRHSNLLDFDLPPMPTPRSIPTVTPRELESMKSEMLSEISSLKANLSGKEAEVASFKAAVGDAEKRVGACMEELREMRCQSSALAEEKENWQKRDREMQTVLRNVKEEIMLSQREREDVESRLEESEKRREAAEIMAQEAESKMAAVRAGRSDGGGVKSPDGSGKNRGGGDIPGSRETEMAVERVARELHAAYRVKHEAKVSALKKSYENRWSRKVQELQGRIDALAEENERLLSTEAGRNATLTQVDPNQSVAALAVEEERREQAVRDATRARELQAEVRKLEAVVVSVKRDLENEREEKGALVLVAEEMMAMQSNLIQQQQQQQQQQQRQQLQHQPQRRPDLTPVRASPAAPQQHHQGQFHHPQFQQPQGSAASSKIQASPSGHGRGSSLSGLRRPGSIKKPAGESRIGGPLGLKGSASAKTLPRPNSGLGVGGGLGGGAGRSGIMSSIERMGSHRGRGGA